MSDWAAGWYADPEQQGQIRYWDGSQWTDHRQPTPEGFGQDGGSDSTDSSSDVDEATRIRPSADRAPETEVMPTSDPTGYGASGAGASGDTGGSSYGSGDSSYGQSSYGSDSSYGQSSYGSGDSSYGQSSYGAGSPSAYGSQQSYGQPGAQPAYGQQQGSSATGAPPSKGGNKLPFIIGGAVLGLLLLCLLGFLAFKAFGGSDDDKTSSSSTAAPPTSTESSSDTSTDSPSPTSSSPTSASPTATTTAKGGGGVQRGDWDKTIEGSGNAVISVPPGDGAGLVEGEYMGNGSTFGKFQVEGVTGTGGDSNDRVFYAFDKFKSTSAYNLTNSGGGTSRLKIEADGKWKITFKRISTAPAFGTSQKGTDGGGVYKWDGKSSDIRVKVTKGKDAYSSRIYVRPVVAGESYNSYLVMESGDKYEGTHTVQAGTKYLVIEAQGDWEITKK